MHTRTLGFLALFMLYTTPLAWAQGYNPPPDSLGSTSTAPVEFFAEYNVQPEVWHFPTPVGSNVDAGGNMSLAIPIMTVPGRGLDFPITFSYSAGIRVQQRASWIGLGWNFDPGSITRDVNGGVFKPYTDPLDPAGTGPLEYYGVDYADSDSLMPDAYYVHLPTGTFPMSQALEGAFSIPVVNDQSSRFYTDQWRPWKIETTASNPVTVESHTTDKPDIEQFTITTDDGTRYVFGMPSIARYTEGHLGSGEKYVSTWRLHAILAADYTGPDIPLIDSPGSWVRFDYRYNASNDYFEFENPAQVLLHQLTYLYRIITPTHMAEFTTAQRVDVDMSINYSYYFGTTEARDMYRNLTSIELKQHEGDGDSDGEPDNATLVRGIRLEQDQWLAQSRFGNFSGNVGPQPPAGTHPCLSGRPLPPGHGNGDCNGKTTLNKVVYFDANGVDIPDYEYAFEYADNDASNNPQYPFVEFSPRKDQGDGVPSEIPSYWQWHYMDDYGFYNDAQYPMSNPPPILDQRDSQIDSVTTDADAWSLTKVIFPTGGWEVYEYENDTLTVNESVLIANYVDRTRERISRMDGSYLDQILDYTYLFDAKGRYHQGGTRIKTILRSGGMGDTTRTTFEYGPGRTTGVPGAFWMKDLITYQEINVTLLFNTRHIPASRGASRVVYDWVERIVHDGSDALRTRTQYTTIGNAPAGQTLERIESVLYHYGFAPNEMYRTVALGNQDWNWGRPWYTEDFDAGGNPVQSIEQDLAFTIQDGNSLFAPVWDWDCGSLCQQDCAPNCNDLVLQSYVDWGYTRNLEVTTKTFPTDGTSGNQKSITENLYHDDVNFVKESKTRRFVPGSSTARWVGTERAFVYEPHGTSNPTESWYLDHNVLSPVVREDVFEDVGSTRTYYSAAITKWDYSNDDELEPRRPYRTYSWQADTFGSKPAFNDWAPGDTLVSSPWVNTLIFDAYDTHGHVLTQRDPLGSTTFQYDAVTPGYNSAYLTRVERAGTGLFMTFEYGLAVGKVSKATDPSGNDVEYAYDDLGRLTEVRNADGTLVADYDYVFADPGSIPTTPNSIETDLHTGTDTYTSRQYFDGLARLIQSQTEIGTSDIASNVTYDDLGRQWQTWKPYEFNLSGYDAAFQANTDGYYDGQGGRPDDNGCPYGTSHYEDNPLGRVKEVQVEGCGPLIESKYGVEAIDTKNYAYVKTTDEKDVVTQVFVDALGNTVRTIAGIDGSSSLETRMDMAYDALGNVTTVYPPKAFEGGPTPNPAWATQYTYDTRSQLIEKATPDVEANYKYRYDDLGNLRFTLDPIRNATPADDGFLYTRYDALGRVIETGLYTGSQSFETADVNDNNFPNSQTTEVITYVYDDYVNALPSGTSSANRLGRLTELQFDGGYYQYFYDKEGRVIDLFVKLDDLSEGKLIEYSYDLQGAITKVHFEQADTTEALELTYIYDGAGRLDKIKSKVLTESSKTTEADYEYWPTGQTKQLKFGAGSIPALDYEYHIRDWLLQINDPSALNGEPFALGLAHEANGNISSMEWATRDHPFEYMTGQTVPRIGYFFEYDDINRLTKADFQYHNGTIWQDHNAYDVGRTVPIEYDLNGNIMDLRRSDEAGTEMMIDYMYHTDNNRLDDVTVGTANYDLDYDANGNMTATRVASTVTHDWRNLPVSTTLRDGTTMTYKYDGNGQRVYKRLVNGTGTTEEVYIRGADGSVLAVFVGDPASGLQLSYWNILSGSAVIGRIVPPN